jgi:hypothetical protein
MLNGHVADCPMKSRMDIVEDYIIAQKTKAADGKNWMDRLWPLIWSALGVVAYLGVCRNENFRDVESITYG